MKRKVRFCIQNQYAWADGMAVQRILPNETIQAIGPFVLLEHIFSCEQTFNELYQTVAGKYSRPHRGITVLTYMLSGEVEHIDSLGNHEKLSSGCAHWIKTGRGIVLDEVISAETRIGSPNVSVIRFWINLPSKYKSGEPEYVSLPAIDIPKQILTHETGWVKILSGEFENMIAKPPCYSKQFLYHIHLEAGKQCSITTGVDLECAAFLLTNGAVVNDMECEAGELIGFGSGGALIETNNNSKTAVDIILFGGEPYHEPIVTEGAFVMNTPHEITQAYNDYYDGKFGDIDDF
jgi:redox-sensitive bicupin YhaK (pirin superfamily)